MACNTSTCSAHGKIETNNAEPELEAAEPMPVDSAKVNGVDDNDLLDGRDPASSSCAAQRAAEQDLGLTVVQLGGSTLGGSGDGPWAEVDGQAVPKRLMDYALDLVRSKQPPGQPVDEARVGPGRIVASYYCASTSYQIH